MKTCPDRSVRPLWSASLLAGSTLFLSQLSALAIPSTVDLGASSGFAILAGAGITVAGPANSTSVTGDIGSFPTASITGLANLDLAGVNHGGDALVQSAKIDLDDAYAAAASRSVDTTFGDAFDLAGQVLPSGVYHGDSSIFLSGVLTLDAAGDPNAVWIFQIGSTLVTSSGSTVVLANGALASRIFWQVGDSATLGASSDFAGSILASESITLDAGAAVVGRTLALHGAVTLGSNSIQNPGASVPTSVPDSSGTILLAGVAMASLRVFGPRGRWSGSGASTCS